MQETGKSVVQGESSIRGRGSSGLVLRISLLMVGLGSDLPERRGNKQSGPLGVASFRALCTFTREKPCRKIWECPWHTNDVNSRTEKYSSQNKEVNARWQ